MKKICSKFSRLTGRMSDKSEIVPEQKPAFITWGEKSTEMSQKQMDMYLRYCEDREAKRREELAEDIKIRDLFLEAGRKAMSEASLSPEEKGKALVAKLEEKGFFEDKKDK